MKLTALAAARLQCASKDQPRPRFGAPYCAWCDESSQEGCTYCASCVYVVLDLVAAALVDLTDKRAALERTMVMGSEAPGSAAPRESELGTRPPPILTSLPDHALGTPHAVSPVMRKILVIECDVTDLTHAQVARLLLEQVVQCTASDPDVPIIGTKVIERKPL